MQPFGPDAPSRPRLAASLRRLGHEVDTLWPGRGRAADGWLGDAAHQARESDHNADRNGIVHALDLTTAGTDPIRLVVALVQHPGVHYVIHDGLIYQRRNRFIGVRYDGPDRHLHHVHVSIFHNTTSERSVRPWLAP